MALTVSKGWGYWLIGILLGLYGTAGVAQNSARDWLDRMSQALRVTDYQGVLVYSHNARLETLSIKHEVRDGIEYERLLHLNGAPRELVRQERLDGDDTAPDWSGDGTTFAGNFARDIGAIETHYRLTLVGSDRIAGRPAKRLQIQPKDSYRYGYQLWVDRSSGLLLKSVLRDPQGRILEQFQFTELEVLHQRSLKPEPASPEQSPHAQEPAQQTDWKIGWLPPGFHLAFHERQAHNPDKLKLERMMFSDGLAAFTLFIEPSRQSALQEGVHAMGATVAVVRQVETAKQDYFVTLIGEVPVTSAQRIASSIQHLQ